MATKMRPSHAIDYGKAAREIVSESQKLASMNDLDKPTAILAALLCEMNFPQERAVVGAKKGRSIFGALQFLRTARFLECPLCTGDVVPELLIRMTPCGHEACETCFKEYFQVKVREEVSLRMNCFYCHAGVEVSALLTPLRRLLSREDYELLEKKVLELSLESSEDFRYCTKCSFGFLNNPELSRAQCPRCRVRMCAKCWAVWEGQHEGVSCEDFKRWKTENDPASQASKVEAILQEDGVRCPNCKMQFQMARGGCLHFECTKCHFAFCMGCGAEFAKADKCKVGKDECADQGLHAHHPRNCYYHVRDLGTTEELLAFVKEVGNVELDESAPEQRGAGCRRVVTDDSMNDNPCANVAYKGGLCERHYKEYLADVIFKGGIDPCPLMSVGQLTAELRRNKMKIPERQPGEEEETYANGLREIVANSIPIQAAE